MRVIRPGLAVCFNYRLLSLRTFLNLEVFRTTSRFMQVLRLVVRKQCMMYDTVSIVI